MPVYLCKSGWDAQDPWRHGVQVYANPFPIEDDDSSESDITTAQKVGNVFVSYPQNVSQRLDGERNVESSIHPFKAPSKSSKASSRIHNPRSGRNAFGHPIRRVRHAEIVLADEVSIWYSRYWLRLRWPGAQGGFAGYIALGTVRESKLKNVMSLVSTPSIHKNELDENSEVNVKDGENKHDVVVSKTTVKKDAVTAVMPNVQRTFAAPEITPIEDNVENDNNNPENESDQEELEISDETTGPPIPLPPRCESTGLYYPSSSAMELLHDYDDGLSLCCPIARDTKDDTDDQLGHGIITSLAACSDVGEPVFCRICREGLHDVNYDSAVAAKPSSTEVTVRPHRNKAMQQTMNTKSSSSNLLEQLEKEKTLLQQATAPHPFAENPLLAPCACSGSMAFVHYLCVEQWRCRSRHPSAKNGLNCETCGSAYALPPPPVRPIESNNHMNNGLFAVNDDEWLDAMPAHVLAALRRPHFWWQLGVAVVRRKWLRPIAPVVISPIVALYCRARRMLKKRGVSRRRWACSLCGRRARWKCVRCLRSYYCSRQCQNVSWHIVHKHVCYKPARFIWSLLLYGGGIAFAVPGTWQEPLIYMTAIALIPLNFCQIGILAGGIATFTKRMCKVDMRGRSLELSVVLITIIMSYLSWGQVNGFFGSTKECLGFFSKGDDIQYDYQQFNHRVLLKIMSAEIYGTIHYFLNLLDKIISSLAPSFIRGFLCSGGTGPNGFCFETIQRSNPNYYMDEENCASDLFVLTFIYIMAFMITMSGFIFSRRDRDRRGRGVAGGANMMRQHGDGHRGRNNFVDMNLGLQRPHQD